MKKQLSGCVIPFKCYAKYSFLEVHAWLHYRSRAIYIIAVLPIIEYRI